MKTDSWLFYVTMFAMVSFVAGCREDEKLATTDGTGGIPVQLKALSESGRAAMRGPEQSLQAYVLDGTDTVYRQSLDMGTGNINFAGDPEKTYRMLVRGKSYQLYSRTFTPRDLDAELTGRALTISLVPALTFTTAGQDGLQFYLDGGAAVSVDWGDGSPIEAYTCGCYLEHLYASPGYYFVSITGELENIEGLGFFYDYGGLSDITLDYLPNLLSFRNGFADSPLFIDFTANAVLQDIELSASKTRYINVPEDNDLLNVHLFLDSGFSATSLNNVIHRVYVASLAENRTGGTMWISQDPFGSTFIAPISNTAKAELAVLRDSLAWDVWPTAF